MSITLYSHKNDTRVILSYIYDILEKENKNIDCECESIERKHFRDYKKDNSDYIFLHNFIPKNGSYIINEIEIEICDFILNNKVQTIIFKEEFHHIKKVTLKNSSKAKIIEFMEEAFNNKFKQKKEKFAEVSGNKIIKKKRSNINSEC